MCAVKIGRLGKFDLNPRGELWRKDENRFGHKLLSKFGWSQGKGLGKNEDGVAENLKVRIKIGNTGVGWNEKLPIGIDFCDYDAVLKDLTKMYQKQGEVRYEDTSLEKRSQQFKNRIHYQKFVRGKDISRYSDKDMSCIFLSREPEKEVESSPAETTVTNIESYPSDISAKKSMPTFNSHLSIADYFAMKMKNKIGSSLNASKESKIFEESSQTDTEVRSKKRKLELKNPKKPKRMKTVESPEEETSSSSQEAPEKFQNSEELNIVKKAKLSRKKNTHKSRQENNVAVEENSLDESHKSSYDSAEEFKTMTENELMSKKRKNDQKSSKKAKKYIKEAQNSTYFEKNSSNVESDDVDPNSSEECATEDAPVKEIKKHKNKFSYLKSCLNKSKCKFTQKRNVSFCDDISYRIIENTLINSDPLETNEQFNNDGAESELKEVDMNHVDVDCAKSESLNPVDESTSEGDCLVNSNDVPECFKLPKRSNYDSWLETQRIAVRMKVYKNMVKKMRKHPILRKTNLLEIKGYGNWGF